MAALELSLHDGKVVSALRASQTIHLLSAESCLSKGLTMKQFSTTRLTSICFAIALFAGLSFLSNECQAQKRRFVLGQELGRFLGAGHGAGYHCNNPGQNTGYYNPYSAHNSQLSPTTYGYGQQRYWDSNPHAIPHSSYTNRDPQQHSVFEELPGQSVRPSFEPAEDRVRKQEEEKTILIQTLTSTRSQNRRRRKIRSTVPLLTSKPKRRKISLTTLTMLPTN